MDDCQKPCNDGQYDECFKLRLLKNYNNYLENQLMNLGKRTFKKWYTLDDIKEKRKLLTLLFTCESEDYGNAFNDAINSVRFSKLNHYLLNTETGRFHFPDLKLDNLRLICEAYHKQ